MDSNYSVNNLEKRFSCEICGKGFRYNSTFLKHRSVHSAAKPFKCEKCDIRLKSKSGFMRHLRRHTEKQAFLCKICNKYWGDAEKFNAHRLWHEGKIPVNSQVDIAVENGAEGKSKTLVEDCKTSIIEQNIFHVMSANDMPINSSLTIVNKKLSLIDNNVIPSVDMLELHKSLDMVQVDNVTTLTKDLNGNINGKCNENAGGNIFVCNFCEKVFKQKQSLENHFLYHDGKNPFLCDKCGKSFIKKDMLRKHLKRHEMKEIPCGMCGRLFSEMRLLKSHLSVHTGEKPYKCETCGLHFRLRKSLLRHIENSHAVQLMKECHICKQGCMNDDDLSKHLSTQHGDILHVCKICGKSFQSVNIYDKCIACHNRYTCDICGLSFSVKRNLIRHIPVHTSQKPYKCKLCERKFKLKSHLHSHFLSHKNYKPHMCDICDQTFRTRHILNNHYLIHTGEKPHSCEICHKTFRTKAQRHVHYRTHTGEQPYACDMCGKQFKSKSDACDHVFRHGNKRPYNCKICKRNFFSKNMLITHSYSHQKIKCDTCGKIFKLKGELNRHYCVIDALPSVCE